MGYKSELEKDLEVYLHEKKPKINFNDLAKNITSILKKGLKHSIKIEDVKEIIKLFCIEMSRYDNMTIIKKVNHIANIKGRSKGRSKCQILMIKNIQKEIFR